MEFSIKTLVVVVDFSRMARPVLGGHKRAAVAAKKFSTQYVRAVFLHDFLLMPLVVHYLIANSKSLFVHNCRHYVGVGNTVAYDYAHILGVADNLGK